MTSIPSCADRKKQLRPEKEGGSHTILSLSRNSKAPFIACICSKLKRGFRALFIRGRPSPLLVRFLNPLLSPLSSSFFLCASHVVRSGEGRGEERRDTEEVVLPFLPFPGKNETLVEAWFPRLLHRRQRGRNSP